MIPQELSMAHNIRAFIEQSLDETSLSTAKYINYYKGLNLKTSFGMGNYAKISWITLRGEGQKTSNGIYVGLLCYKKQRLLIIPYGISETNAPSLQWRLSDDILTIKDYFKKNQLERPERYGSSYVYRAYSLDSLDYSTIVSDLNSLIDEYKNLLEENDLPRDATFVAPDPRGNGKMKEFYEETESPSGSMTKCFTPIQKIFFGTPGGGKSHKVKLLIEEEHKAKDRQFRTTFHPDSDYASFVGSYKPVMKGADIVYTYVPQVFTLAYIAAWNNPTEEYFLDIEEINRGNCAQIFGDLFQLLDRNKEGYSEYPIKADTDLGEYLKNGKNQDGNDILANKDGIKDGNLVIPANLSIVATMNTSDQSLFPMDSAFKRRWEWEFVPSTFNEKDNFNIVIGPKTYKWHTFLIEANKHIKQATDSEDKQMGTYFIKSDLTADMFKSKVMYYLWSEICKDEYKTPNNFFRYIDGDNNEQEFTFNELYSNGDIALLQKFMKFMEVNAVEEAEETLEDTE